MDYDEKSNSEPFPQWLNEKFLQDSLKHDRGERGSNIIVKINNVSIAVSKGDNYLSIIYRVEIEITNKSGISTMSLLIKNPPYSDNVQKMIEEVGVFRREISMYNETLPKINRVIEKYLGASETISCKSYTCSRENTLILEDLRPEGYRMADRLKQLDYEHCQLVLRTLAKLHAASVVVHREHPSLIESLEELFYCEAKRDTTEPLMRQVCDGFASFIEECPGYEEFGEKVRNLRDKVINRCMELCKPRERSLNVLNHGDCWMNNILFRYDTGSEKPLQVKFVDFQISRYSTPALDLIYFLYTSPREEVLLRKDLLIQEYHEHFLSFMKSFGVETSALDLDTLMREINDAIEYAFSVSISVRAIVLSDPVDSPDLGEMLEKEPGEGDQGFTKSYRSRTYRNTITKLLTQFEKEGLFDS